ncbi:MAG: hypothetical protein B7Y41_01890 [Hydrogenophilales bacterium 28-61-23]|nr:MAG: hypothetical protein B7Y41_01890 [Hydrogenophilales bacterium 28-61-23]
MYAEPVCRARPGPKHVASTTRVIALDSPRRAEAEAFIRGVFTRHYAARVASFAPDLMLLEHVGHSAKVGRIAAAAGWRGTASARLYLESYLDDAVQVRIGRLAGHPVARERIAEVGNLASVSPGGGARMILALAEHLDRLGYEWVVFTATRELIGIFAKLGLPPLALGIADPSRLGAAASDWGRYYDSRPVVVAGRIRLALERPRQQPGLARV